MSWNREFCEDGGYDCMYDAFYIKDADTGLIVCEVDFRYHGQESCKPYGQKVMASAEAAADEIAAAPELLEACEAALFRLEQTCHCEYAEMVDLRAAIAKAKGQA